MWRDVLSRPQGGLTVIGGASADFFKNLLNHLFALVTIVLVHGGQGLDGILGRASESERTIVNFALIQREGSVAENDEAAVMEFAFDVFMEVE